MVVLRAYGQTGQHIETSFGDLPVIKFFSIEHRNSEFSRNIMSKNNDVPQAYVKQEEGYRIKALRLYPWVCGRCAREFEYSNLRELTVHHVDHNHSNNPEDGSNWELLCIYCHDNEHNKYHEHIMYGGSTTERKVEAATHSPFADLKALLNKSK